MSRLDGNEQHLAILVTGLKASRQIRTEGFEGCSWITAGRHFGYSPPRL